MPRIFKILVLALGTSFSLARVSIKNSSRQLNWVLYIHYSNWFKNNKIRSLINSRSEINAIAIAFVAKLDLKVCFTNIRAQKIDSSILKNLK